MWGSLRNVPRSSSNRERPDEGGVRAGPQSHPESLILLRRFRSALPASGELRRANCRRWAFHQTSQRAQPGGPWCLRAASASSRDAFPMGTFRRSQSGLDSPAKFPCLAASLLCPDTGGSRQPHNQQIRYYRLCGLVASYVPAKVIARRGALNRNHAPYCLYGAFSSLFIRFYSSAFPRLSLRDEFYASRIEAVRTKLRKRPRSAGWKRARKG